ncbi:hypothetical protein AUJ13_02835 [Candidatus Micrarchaeota archaeon CG1_02_49_24]|nr:MAG: hypothetical protein AUJ13_02835 [Candidatus Micrarchaeota archaeon CG1_02_49_24]PIU82347.1 MAG: hypothetical protein COS70_01820 [Candidatus Micrarchaeota archaeon CG06_land_8_20_14_3_00_50_6]HII53574.1 hypothetical protein [Candidatus Micrarchaeota archaeon]
MEAKKEVLSINVKKVIPWATGLAIFITKEARTLEWTDKDQVMITAFRDKEGDGIEIRLAPIKRPAK